MRILIVGSDANAYTLAETFSNDKDVDVVFVAPGNKYISKFAECIDISATDNEELLDFVVANEISLTVVTSLAAIENDIAGYFADFRRNIFAPSYDAAFPLLYKSVCKRTLYKLKIPTVKFGIFDRENQAVDYVSSSRKPLVIKTDSIVNAENPILVNSFSKAKRVLENLFIQPENNIIIEDYISANQVSLYFITDGYSALPLGTCSSDKDSSLSVFSPDNVLSKDIVKKILNTVIYPYIDYCSSKNNHYSGIIGVDLLVEDEEYKVTELTPFFKEIHLQSILPRIKQNLSELFLSVAVGSFSDEYNSINLSDDCIYSKTCEQEFQDSAVSEYDDENLFYSRTNNGKILLSQKAKTISRAKNNHESAIMYFSSVKNSDVEETNEKS